MEHQDSTADAPARTPVLTGPDPDASRHQTSEDTPDATPGPSTHDAPDHSKPTPSLQAQESTDSGIDAGSSSEYDQENHGDHIIEVQESDFSDEG
jgi:hypothetical protein